MTRAAETLRSRADRLRRLADDLDRIADGGVPTAEELASSPLIQDWYEDSRLQSCLRGTISAHPSFDMETDSRTSELWLLAPNLGWARTYSRWYRLGRRQGEPR
ncbi:DUF6634 family protein [Faunimonas pinastri]|uniref:DUF6634 family protein n=1 Tax=Faunimonas pinastri TaxID=1855383 RepID=UPI003D164B4F